MLAIVGDGIGAGGIDHDRTVDAVLFLIGAVAVVPIGAGLDDVEFIIEGRPRHDPGEADARNAVHLERDEQALPVERGVLVQRIGHRQPDVLAFSKAQQRRRQVIRSIGASRG